jgi:hypothetical protein
MKLGSLSYWAYPSARRRRGELITDNGDVSVLRDPERFRYKQMDKINYLLGDFPDEFLHAQANAGDYLLDRQAFQYRPTQDEMKMLALEGQALLFIDSLEGK